MLYEKVLAPLLFMLEAESAHNMALTLLRWASMNERVLTFLRRDSDVPESRLAQTLGGLRFPNPVGLAAGFDKNGVAGPALAALGFGFMTIGTVTPRRGQPGKPRPRLFRDTRNQALWNRLGFNNEGADALAERLEKQAAISIPLGISLGKAVETPLEEAATDYADSLERLYPHADFFEICISSPNTDQLRHLQSEEPLEALLDHLVVTATGLARRAGAHRRKPLWPKFAPDMPPDARNRAVAICQRQLDPELDAIVMGNSTIDPRVNPAVEKGGYSGRPLFPKALAEVRSVGAALEKEARGQPLTLVGCGGIFHGDDALGMLQQSRCRLVQLHSAFPYRGPLIARKICRELVHAMERVGAEHIAEISAREHRSQHDATASPRASTGLSQSPGS